MSHIPTLYTPRLVLRPFTLADGTRVQELAGDKRIAAASSHIPHPYQNGDAELWTNLHQISAEAGLGFDFAVTLAGTRTPGRELDPTETGHLIGAISLYKHPQPALDQACIGFWIGVHYWNKGFATEAGCCILEFAFRRLKLDRVISGHSANNPASGRVLQKLGLIPQPDTHADEKSGRRIENIEYALARDAWSRKSIIHRWKTALLAPLVSH
jgi:[ribosomal protein S5]-alanine N-acetyltransferase